MAAIALMARPAVADVPVIDIGVIANGLNQLNEARNQLTVLNSQLHAFTNSLDVAGLNPGLMLPNMQNPMGGLVNELGGLVKGVSITPGGQQMLQQDRFYQATGTDLAATTMNQRSVSLANIKAQALQMIGNNSSRITSLSGFIGQLTGAQDISQTARINGRLSIENQNLAAQTAQFQQLRAMADMERETSDQRTIQRIRQDDEDTLAHLTGGTAAAGVQRTASELPADTSPTFAGQ